PGTIGGNLVEKIDDPSIGAVIFNQAIEPIATGPATFITGYAQHIELAGEIAEYDCAIAGHGLFSSAKLPPDWSILVDIRQYGLRG
ncbi:MAG: hypothetical protein WCF52_09215, partial [Pseudolabrys sp.]